MLLPTAAPYPSLHHCSTSGVDLGATVIFDYPSVEALAGFLAPQLPAPPAGEVDDCSDIGAECVEHDQAPCRSGSDSEQHPPNVGAALAAPSAPPPRANKNAPKLTKPGYFTVRIMLVSCCLLDSAQEAC